MKNSRLFSWLIVGAGAITTGFYYIASDSNTLKQALVAKGQSLIAPFDSSVKSKTLAVDGSREHHGHDHGAHDHAADSDYSYSTGEALPDELPAEPFPPEAVPFEFQKLVEGLLRTGEAQASVEDIEEFNKRMSASVHVSEAARQQFAELFRTQSGWQRQILENSLQHTSYMKEMLIEEADYILETQNRESFPVMFDLYGLYEQKASVPAIEQGVDYIKTYVSDSDQALSAISYFSRLEEDKQYQKREVPVMQQAVVTDTLEYVLNHSTDDMLKGVAVRGLYGGASASEGASIGIKYVSEHPSSYNVIAETLSAISTGRIEPNEQLNLVINSALSTITVPDEEREWFNSLFIQQPFVAQAKKDEEFLREQDDLVREWNKFSDELGPVEEEAENRFN